MEELKAIAAELHAIRVELKRLADLEERKQNNCKHSKAPTKKSVPDASTIAGTLKTAFSDRNSIKRSDLYKIELNTARTENRQPIPKHTFFKMVESAGYYLKKISNGYYFFAFNTLEDNIKYE